MKRITALLILATMAIATWAQAAATPGRVRITGQVADRKSGEPEPTAMLCIATQRAPKTAIKKAVTDTLGRFELSIPAKAGQYQLSAVVLGKKAAIRPFSISATDTLIQVGTVYVTDDTRTLKEVEVVAQKPLVVMDVDKLTYDVASDPDALTMNVSDIMNKVPLIDVDGDGNIRMSGTTNFLILQNGRRTAVTRHPKDILRALPAELVKSIEVITSPGAKYDAEGIGGIINIVMQKRYEGHLTTLNGTVNTLGYAVGATTTTKVGRFSIDGYANYNRILVPEANQHSQTYNLGSESQGYQDVSSRQKQRGNTEFANINASYEIDSLRLITMSLSGMGSQQRQPGWNRTETWNRDHTALAYSYLRSGQPKNSFVNGTAGIDYQRVGRRNRQRMSTLSYQLSTNPSWNKGTTLYSEIVNHTSTDIIEALQLFDNRTDRHDESVEHTLQYDFTTPIGKHHTVESGLKYIARNNESTNDIYDSRALANDYTYNDQRSSHYKNSNDILAGYLSYTYRGRVFSLMPGLRYEYTHQDIKYLSGAIGADGNYSSHYAYLVPSFKVNFKLGAHQSLRLDYSMRLSRPSIYYLNPYFNNINPQYITQGNGDLEAERSHSVGATYGNFTRKFNLSMTLQYRRLNNGIEQVSHIIGDEGEYFDGGKHYAAPGAVYTTYQNIGRTQYTGLDTYLRWNLTRRASLTLDGTVSYIDIEDPASQLRNHGWQFSGSTMLSWSLPADFRMMARLMYSGRNIALQGQSGALVSTFLSLSRQFLKDRRLSLSLSASEPFSSWYNRTHTTHGANFYTLQHEQIKRQCFTFTLMYRFGRLKRSATQRAQHGISNDDLKRAPR